MNMNNSFIQKVLSTAAICCSSEEEDENSDDVIENSPVHEKRKTFDIIELGEQSIEAPPYSPLTPRPKRTVQTKTKRSQKEDIIELGEQSIKAPPYSPLTPRPKRTVQTKTKRSQKEDIIELGEQSIEAPPYSPLTPRPKRTVETKTKRSQKEDLASCDGSVKSVGAPQFSPLTPKSSLKTDNPKKKCLKDFKQSKGCTNIEENSMRKLHVKPKKDTTDRTDNTYDEGTDKPSTSRLTRATAKNLLYNNGNEQPCSPELKSSFDSMVNSPSSFVLHVTKTYSRKQSKKTEETFPLPESPCGSIDPQLLELIDEIDFEGECEYNNSDDSVKDPDYEEGYGNGNDSDSDRTVCEDEVVERPNVYDENRRTAAEGTREVKTLLELALKSFNTLTSREQSEERIETGKENSDKETEGPKGRPKKGRKRKLIHTKSEAKQRKYNNEIYFNRKNQLIEPKKFKDFECSCKNNCHEKVSTETRKREFNKFVHSGSYTAQTLYIIACVREVHKKRVKTEQTHPNKARQFSRIYEIDGVKVCKDMFINTFQISPQKINTCLRKKRDDVKIADKRGDRVAGWNKISESDIKFAKQVIEKVPKYESHYRRNSTDKKFLPPGTTLVSLYELYKKEFDLLQDQESQLISFSSFKKIFYDNFNLKFKSLKKDTCNKCDKFAIAKNNAQDPTDRRNVEEKHADHLKLAENSRSKMNKDFEIAKTDKKIECVTFDLEKTLPLPRIPTNVVFYKRQLWVYNSGIHVASNDKGYCYVWVEGEAGRGAQEVGSCLISHIKNELRPEVENLITWSDSCGGQNRNIKIVLMLKALLHSHPKLKTICCRYLEPGHSFLPNDTDFSKIEVRLKQHERLYTVEDYINVMKNCKKANPLQVVRMKSNMFLSTENLEKVITNRKICEKKQKVSWLTTKEILLKKEDQNLIYMRKNFEEDYQVINIQKKRGKAKEFDIQEGDLISLWPNGKEIPEVKLNDIKSMMEFIPVDARSFYENLKGNRGIEDDVDGFGDTPDFHLFYSDEE